MQTNRDLFVYTCCVPLVSTYYILSQARIACPLRYKACVGLTVSLHLEQGHLQLQEIGTVCARALERQTRHAQLQQQSTATVLLDEGGLPGVSLALHSCLSPAHMWWQTL